MKCKQLARVIAMSAMPFLAVTLLAQGNSGPNATWKQNTAKSTCTVAAAGGTCAPPPQVPTTRKMEDLGGGLIRIANDGVNAMGERTGNRIVARRDGQEYPIAAMNQAGYLTIAFTVKSPNPWVADYVTKLDGKVTSTATETITADGKTMTVTVKNVSPQSGQATTNVVQVWDRQ